jgi:stage II sporulation protein M
MKKIKEIYSAEWQWFKSTNLKTFLTLILVFLVFAVASHFYLIGHPEIAEDKVMEIVKALMEKLPVLEGGFKLFIAIFLNNLFVATLAMLAGLIPFLFIPVWAVGINAIAMGIISSYVYIKGYNLFALLVLGIVPHGIIEIPTLLYACSLGVLLSMRVIRILTNMSSSVQKPGSLAAIEKTQGEGREEAFIAAFKRVLRAWLLVIIPLLLLAAAIETFITPHLVQLYLGDQPLFSF